MAVVGQLVLPVPLLVLCRLLHFFSQYKDLHIQIIGNSKLSLVVSANDLLLTPFSSFSLNSKDYDDLDD